METFSFFFQQLFLLVNDAGYDRYSGIIWQTLSSTCGDCVFVDGDFKVRTTVSDHDDGRTKEQLEEQE